MARITEEMYASIPDLIAQGKNRVDIAEMFGVKVDSLTVYCSRRKISLRSLKMTSKLKQVRRRDAFNLAADTLERQPEVVQLVALRLEARARGTTEIGLVARLIEMIVKDRLYDAVLGKIGEELEAA